MKRPLDGDRDVNSLVVMTILLAAVTWQRCGSPFIDWWGRELYTAMSVARGLGIPKSVQLLFGSLSTLLNGAILFFVGERIAAILVWLALSTYPHLVRVGDDNFLTPYSHGTTHGRSLGLLSIAYILQALRRQGVGWWIGAGFACGFSLFAKPEAGLATLPTLITGILAGWIIRAGRSGREALAALGGLGAAAVIVASVARLAGGTSFREHIGPYRPVASAVRMDLPFCGGGSSGQTLAATFLTGVTLFFSILAVVPFAERRDARSEATDDTRLTGRWRAASVALPVLAVTVCAASAPFAWHSAVTLL